MKLKKLMIILTSLLSSVLFGQEIDIKKFINKKSQSKYSRQVRESGSGSGVGGGDLYTSLYQLDLEASEILKTSLQSARLTLNFEGDVVLAIKKYHFGLQEALLKFNNSSQNLNSFLFRSLIRTLKLSRRLSYDDVVFDQKSLDFYSPKELDEVLSFYEAYYNFLIINFVNKEKIDPEQDVLELVKEQVSFWFNNSSDRKTEGVGYYSILDIQKSLLGLSFVLFEVSKDLEQINLSNRYKCHIALLKVLSKEIEEYLYSRNENSSDMIVFNNFMMRTQKLLNHLDFKNCIKH